MLKSKWNKLLLGLIIATPLLGWEFRDLQRKSPEPTVAFQLQDDGLVHKPVRICTVTGDPVPNILVEAIILRGAVEIKIDTCVTDNTGMCTLDIPRGSNGRIQIASAFENMTFVSMGENNPVCSQPGG